MRSFLIKASVLTGIIILLFLSSEIVLAEYSPISPGNFLFPFQNIAEQAKSRIYSDQIVYTNYMMDLVERRIRDLANQIGTKNELISLRYLDKSIDQATSAIGRVPKEKVDPLRQRLLSLAKRADDVQNELKLVPIENNAVYIAFQSKIKALLQETSTAATLNEAQSQSLVITPDISGFVSGANLPIEYFSAVSGLIPFPPGSQGAIHAFYPLVGKHATLACGSCHNEGTYLGTSKTCILCHSLKLPNPHYPGDCEICHNSISWTDIHFDHASTVATNCSECHEKDKPADHYKGQCSACHITQDWITVTFDHVVAGAEDCVSCHAKVEPANHYPGQCSNCHNTSNWTSVDFNHKGLTDCISCHAAIAPANHYSGQCSNCHDTGVAWANAQFNHSGFTDCISCHAAIAPANHYSGQCSNCHDPGTPWANARFDHSGLTDCVSCHTKDAPANHYPGQCSNCHDAGSSWTSFHFNHSGFTDCISCHAGNAPANHYSGQCSNCHDPNSSWQNASFNHSGFTDCISCHAGNAPANHYPGQCSNCHNTSSWSGAVFNHAGFTDCISCHLNDRPSDHDSGQCSECHNTQNWGDGGGDGAIDFIRYGKLQSFDCTACHTAYYAVIVGGINQ